MADEGPLLRALMVRAPKLGGRLFRNNVGLGWIGRSRRLPNSSTVQVFDARPLHAGLCKGSSDLIGWRTITVTPDMVGQKLAVFWAVEAKTPGVAVTPEQEAFLQTLQDQGGRALVAWEETDLK